MAKVLYGDASTLPISVRKFSCCAECCTDPPEDDRHWRTGHVAKERCFWCSGRINDLLDRLACGRICGIRVPTFGRYPEKPHGRGCPYE